MIMAGRESKFTERVSLKGTESRLKELVVYIASMCQDDPAFGAVKLNKVLFNADFRSQRLRGRPVTGAAYFRLPAGPAPRAMLPTLRELHQEGALLTQQRLVGGKVQKRPVALRLAHLDAFDGMDIAIVDQVIDELWGKSATAVSNESHGVQWRTRSNKDPIPYEAAYLSDDPVTADDVCRAEELIRELRIGPA
jgi:hypothetical protein